MIAMPGPYLHPAATQANKNVQDLIGMAFWQCLEDNQDNAKIMICFRCSEAIEITLVGSESQSSHSHIVDLRLNPKSDHNKPISGLFNAFSQA
jgi:hypothetical protein